VIIREYRQRYQKATKKEKQVLLGEFTRLTGYHWKSPIRLLSAKPVREVLVFVDRKPEKPGPPPGTESSSIPMRSSSPSGFCGYSSDTNAV
jgi:hypothetical protein